MKVIPISWLVYDSDNSGKDVISLTWRQGKSKTSTQTIQGLHIMRSFSAYVVRIVLRKIQLRTGQIREINYLNWPDKGDKLFDN